MRLQYSDMGVDVLSESFHTIECMLPRDTYESRVSNLQLQNKAKRSLFGPVDHQEVMSYLRKELRNMEQDAMDRWNFDFANEKPLNQVKGRYTWKCINNINEQVLTDESNNEVTKIIKSNCKYARKSNVKSCNHPSRQSKNKNCTTRQTTISDFMKCRKSRHSKVLDFDIKKAIADDVTYSTDALESN